MFFNFLNAATPRYSELKVADQLNALLLLLLLVVELGDTQVSEVGFYGDRSQSHQHRCSYHGKIRKD